MGIRVLFVLVSTLCAATCTARAQDAQKTAAAKAQQIRELDRLLERWTKHYAAMPRVKKEALHKLALAQGGLDGNIDLLPLLDFKVTARQRLFFKGLVAFDLLCTLRLDDDPTELDDYCETIKSQLDVILERVRTMREAYQELSK